MSISNNPISTPATRQAPPIGAVSGPAAREDVPPSGGPPSGDAGVTVTLAGQVSPQPASTYANPGKAMPVVGIDYFSFGDQTALGSASGPTRLEYNVYRPDGIAIDSSTRPFTITATGEKLDDATARKYQALLEDVTKQRIAIYQSGQEKGMSNAQILAELQSFDNNLPASYQALVGHSSMSDPRTRYNQVTHGELMGGPAQTE